MGDYVNKSLQVSALMQ